MRIVFMGTPDFAAVSLQRLLDAHFDVVGNRPAGLSAGKDA